MNSERGAPKYRFTKADFKRWLMKTRQSFRPCIVGMIGGVFAGWITALVWLVTEPL